MLAQTSGKCRCRRGASAAARAIELAKINGEVQAQSLQRIGELVSSNPQERRSPSCAA